MCANFVDQTLDIDSLRMVFHKCVIYYKSVFFEVIARYRTCEKPLTESTVTKYIDIIY